MSEWPKVNNNVDPSEQPSGVDPSEQPCNVDSSGQSCNVDPSELPGEGTLESADYEDTV